jgi:hypothetical protein
MTMFTKGCSEFSDAQIGLKKVTANKFMKAVFVAPRHEEKALAVKLLTKEHFCCDQATD